MSNKYHTDIVNVDVVEVALRFSAEEDVELVGGWIGYHGVLISSGRCILGLDFRPSVCRFQPKSIGSDRSEANMEICESESLARLLLIQTSDGVPQQEMNIHQQ